MNDARVRARTESTHSAGETCRSEALEGRVLLAVVYDAPTTAVGDAPTGLVVADFDDDGILDAATADFDSSTVTVLLGRGDGSFTRSQTLDTLGAASRVVAGDLNGDGALDLVVSEFDNNSIAIFLGNGDGTFGDATRVAGNGGPVGLALADLNGDGDLDLVATNFLLNFVGVYLGDGAGGFGAATLLAGGTSPRAVAVGDLTGNGAPDLVVAASGDDAIRVFLNDGGGAFAAPVQYLVGANPEGVALGDVDGDGHLDVVVACANDDVVTTRLNDGTGVLTNPGFLVSVDARPRSVALADLNGDGRLDFIAGNADASNVQVGFGLGNGNFTTSPGFLVGQTPRGVTLEDMDEDGALDVLVVNEESDTLTVLFGDGGGEFAARRDSATGAPVGAAMAAADLDGDGRDDLVAAFPEDGTVRVYFSDGLGNFLAGPTFATGGRPVFVAIGDLNGDGRADLAVSLNQDDDVAVFFGDGAGGFIAGGVFATSDGPQEVRVGDMDGDGVPDLVVACSTASVIDVLINDGTGSFSAPVSIAVPGNPVSIRLGDLDNDGDLDIAMLTSTGGAALQWLRNNGDMNFIGPSIAADLGGLGVRLALADLDGDGDLDAVATTTEGKVVVWRNNGLGFYSPAGISVEVGAGVGAIEFADVNVDGKPDAIVAVQGSDRVAVLEGDGGLGFLLPIVSHVVAASPAGLAVGRFEGRAYLGVATLSATAGTISAYNNIRTPSSIDGLQSTLLTLTRDQQFTLSVQARDNPGSIRRVTFWADFNGNGNTDEGETLGSDEDGEDGWSILAVLGSGAPLGPGLTIIAMGVDFAGVETNQLTLDLTVIYSLLAADGAVVSGVRGADGRYYVGARNSDNRPLLYRQIDPGSESWDARDLQAATGSPALIGDVSFFVDGKDGLLYAAAVSADGLLLFVLRNGAWSFRNLSTETGFGDALTGQLTVFVDTVDIGHIAVIAESGNILLFTQTGEVNPQGGFVWSPANLSTDHLSPQGMSTPAFVGRITSYVTSWNARNIVGVDASGRLHTVWIADAEGFTLWRTDDLSAITGAPTITGGLTIYLTSWDGINIAGTDESGSVLVTWWVPQFGGDWEVSDLTDLFSGPQLAVGSLTSYVTPWGGLNVAGVGPDGDLVIYWWVPQFGGEWVVSSFDEVLPADSPRPDGGGLSGYSAADGRLNVFGQSVDREIIRYHWDPGADVWTPENLTEVAERM
ncbi:MAG TPA: FG-GAP-like repeat-containing protein [Phycisphaerales bacterium]|nr:FG-GAP-like repeat-containing protein [Phycisphaerales bacterium]